ncbi:hypothetical protein G3567_12860 [Psychroflexus sp. YR1-1]|uniref:Uncharacterized protein n=1 Tax=Psychroflexus aurantiacus TaxID=2709310 RepID=A0A6B3R7F8_9FLAO|nr:hypothetical protein [Psychroflexus aurantiacus]NEV95027.1 hypothetical protein [Psychroflexus aurantiacus]
MILSPPKKEQLLSFIKSHYVDYHDVRLLIAKDLEEDITTQMEEDETLSFDDALKRTYKTYGVIGFSDASEAYMNKINTYFYKKVLLKILRDELLKAYQEHFLSEKLSTHSNLSKSNSE